MQKTLTLSLIIPVYNEENHLAECLESIAHQSVMPDEVIVVNNNSTDNTVSIAQKYDFVTVLHEDEQGLIPARNHGFQASHGLILGRLDADSVLSPDWVKTVMAVFEDDSIDAVTGPAKAFIDSHFPMITSTIASRLYFWYSWTAFRFQILWGPNMAVRRSAWQEVAGELNSDDKAVHEDQDMSVVLKAHGKTTCFNSQMLIHTDGRRISYLPKILEYELRKRKTIALHKANGNLTKARRGGMNPIAAFLLSICLMPIALLLGVSSGLYTIEKALKLRS